MVCVGRGGEAQYQIKKIKRATGKGGGDKVKPKNSVTPKFPLHSQRDALKQKKGQVTAA